MSYKDCLPLKVFDVRFLHNTIAFDLWIGDKLYIFISLYRSPNHSYDDCESRNWYNKDNTSNKRRKIKVLTLQNGLHQETNEPTHILNISSICMDLIFNSQTYLLKELGVQPSLRPNYHHK